MLSENIPRHEYLKRCSMVVLATKHLNGEISTEEYFHISKEIDKLKRGK